MDITLQAPRANSGTTGTTGSSGTASGGSGVTSASEQQDRFMRLLVAQMKNQDPLNPMDNAQMTSQVAQINTVAGIEKLNETVQGLMAGFATLQLQSASQLPGRKVLVEGSRIALADGQAAGGVSLGGKADTVTVKIVGPDGKTVRTLELGASNAGVRSFSWDGKDDQGQPVADGDYRMVVGATAAGKPVTATALVQAQVRGVTPTASGISLDLGPDGTHAWSDIKSFL